MYNFAVKNDSDIVSCNFRMVYSDRIVDCSTVDFTKYKVDSMRNIFSMALIIYGVYW